ncbi:Putative AC9 transposase [Linum grandiflorum]
MIMLDEKSFRCCEREGFLHFMSRVCPMFKIPYSKIVRKDCAKLFIERKDSLKSFFKSKGIGQVSITTDCWTSLKNDNYITITTYFISRSWQLHKRIICFKNITSHTREDIANAVLECLDEWDLKNVHCCTVDNASSDDVAVRHMREQFEEWGTNISGGRYLNMCCVAHITNLVVSDGLNEIGLSVKRVWEAMRWITISPSRLEIWKTVVNSMNIQCKRS